MVTAADLPGAVVEELFRPTEVVAIRKDDGGVSLLLYLGDDSTGQYPAMKHAVLSRDHAEGLRQGLERRE